MWFIDALFAIGHPRVLGIQILINRFQRSREKEDRRNSVRSYASRSITDFCVKELI